MSPPVPLPASGWEGLRRGSTDYRRAVLASLAAGLATFNALYCTQAILPTLVTSLNVSPTTAALTISATTGALAICIVPISIFSERFGRGRVLVISALLATMLGLCLPLAHSIWVLIALRAIQGIFIAGVPAVAMAWLSEEIHHEDLAKAMGIYIAGNTVGGLSGRLTPALLLDITTWRWALFATTLCALIMAITMAVMLPQQRRFQPRTLSIKHELTTMLAHWTTPSLSLLFATAFIGLGISVSVYNYIGFRMIHTFQLSEALVGTVFLMYLAGTWSSARAGIWAGRIGRGRGMMYGALAMLLGLALMLWNSLTITLIGLFIFTAAFFLIHSIASGWVGLIATTHRAAGASMYLLSYYVGSSVVGWLSGYAFDALSWHGFIGWLSLWTIALLGIAVALRRLAT
ncbi:Hypothetical protein ES271_0649 [Corynebacterium pseudotuberculosis]|uniref:MFS transporter n=1 Tax=Corynebacterium pseudotuberculosis TaxID=1719 RepID=UPI00122F2569|nr:MFS transporter [Corynebacterium pseudotuberculosis]QEQ33413.1 Hypothetical protein ES271_0649 [Corynebacterium pseudotuberculosis]